MAIRIHLPGTLWAVFLLLLGAGFGTAARAECWNGQTVSEDGKRRLALVVGVAEYPGLSDADLTGPVSDARQFRDLLAQPKGFHFPPENVCLLLDGQATQEAVVQAFQRALIEPARQGDIAVFYFAGHGGQRKDLGGDETIDHLDETILLHDAKPEKSTHLVDDRLSVLVRLLQAKTEFVTIVMDTCNSASNSRGDLSGPFRSRFFSGVEDAANYVEYGGGLDDADDRVVRFSAAADGAAAQETAGMGVFTAAMLLALSEPDAGNLTYEQLDERMRPLIARESRQIPYLYGSDLRQKVFGGAVGSVPLSWTVRDVWNGGIDLKGLPLPGFDVGAELRIYDALGPAAAKRDPAKAKATVQMETATAFTGEARVIQQGSAGESIRPGDVAVLVRPGRAANLVTVSILRDGAGGLSPAEEQAVSGILASDPEGSRIIAVVPSGGQYRVEKDAAGNLLLRGPENAVRWSSYPAAPGEAGARLASQLRGFSIQKALLGLQGEGGNDFKDDQTLHVSLEPVAGLDSACAHTPWVQAQPNRMQLVPVCHSWRIKVQVAADSPFQLLIGGFLASSDGSLASVARCNEIVKLTPGGKVWTSRKFTSVPPVGVSDHIFVAGLREENGVNWCDLLATAPGIRQRGPGDSPFSRALKDYLTITKRAFMVSDGEETTWTRSLLTTVTVDAPP